MENKVIQNNKIVCYTCVTGGYDSIKDPLYITPGIDYICFSDMPFPRNIKVWKFQNIPKELVGLDDVRRQRVVKICPHRYLDPKYDVSIWIDGNILVTGDLQKLVSQYDLEKYPLYTRIHPGRKCIYEEAKAILGLKKESPEIVERVITRYRSEGYPEKIGLAETCVILRKHNQKECRLFDETWATEVLLNSKRDQLSFNYVAWRQKFMIGYMMNEFHMNENQFFRLTPHGHI